MEKNLISVIMPVYNIEKKKNEFLKAVNSVLNQTYSRLELIIVNDGSTDQTLKTINKVIINDNRVKLINKNNGGVESARRAGLEIAKGEFIMHIDQDDMYRLDAFEIFYNNIIDTNADVVIANSSRFIWTTLFTKKSDTTPAMQKNSVIEHDIFMKEYYKSFFGINDLPVNIWNKMYRKTFIDSVPNPPLTGLINEDLSYNMHILPYANKISIINDCLYYYRFGGFTCKYDSTILNNAFSCYQLKMKQIKKYQLDEFIIYTSIELLNYINSHFYQNVLYNNLSINEFIENAKCILETDEVNQAIKVVKEYDKYHNVHVDAMINKNYSELYNYETKMKNENKTKQLIKNLLIKLF